MNNAFIFSKKSKYQYDELETGLKARIQNKLSILKTHPDIWSVIERLAELKNKVYKLRIGQYRILLEIKTQERENTLFQILEIDHRSRIYR